MENLKTLFKLSDILIRILGFLSLFPFMKLMLILGIMTTGAPGSSKIGIVFSLIIWLVVSLVILIFIINPAILSEPSSKYYKLHSIAGRFPSYSCAILLIIYSS